MHPLNAVQQSIVTFFTFDSSAIWPRLLGIHELIDLRGTARTVLHVLRQLDGIRRILDEKIRFIWADAAAEHRHAKQHDAADPK